MKAILVCCILLISGMNKSISQNFITGVYDRIDTTTVTDLETGLTDSSISKVIGLFLDAANCDSLPIKFKAQDCSAEEAQVRLLKAIEFRCNGILQRAWEGEWNIESFNLVIYKAKQPPRTIHNMGFEFTDKARKLIANIKSGEKLKFDRIIINHPLKGQVIAGFSLHVL